MYVRNYSSDPRRPPSAKGSTEGDGAPLNGSTDAAASRGDNVSIDSGGKAAVDSPLDGASATSDENISSVASHDYSGTATLRERSASAESVGAVAASLADGAQSHADDEVKREENVTAAPQSVFGHGGLPRQPLRRRKLPIRAPSMHFTANRDGDCDEERVSDEHTRDGDRPHRDAPRDERSGSDGRPDSDCEAESSRDGCRKLLEEVKEDVERRRFGPFSQDDLLLGGLMLLLLNDHACDDVVLLLGFLFLSGRHPSKKQELFS